MSNPQQRSIRVVAIRQPFAVFEQRPWQPPLNVYETGDSVVLVAEIAGVDPADLHIDVQPMLVGIHGTRRVSLPPGLERLHRIEIASGPFQVEVPLATPVNPDRAEARYNNGLLEIRIPFAQQVVQRVVVIQLGEGDVR